MSTECHWKVRLASQRSKRLYLDCERLLRRLETNRMLFEVVPSGGCIPRWVFPTERGQSSPRNLQFLSLTDETDEIPGVTPGGKWLPQWRIKGGVRGARPSLILDQTEARRAKKIFFINHPPYLRVWMTASPPLTPPYPKAVPPK